MDVEAFDPRTHVIHVETWLRGHGLRGEIAHDLPRVGFIVSAKTEYIAAGFLRSVEGGHLMLECLITNPESSPEMRNEAVDVVVGKLILTAQKMGGMKLFAYTSDKNTLVRSKKFGFIAQPHTVIVLDL